MDKFALYMSTDNPAWADNVLSALTRDDLDKRYKEIQDEHINVLLTILGKSDDNIAVIEEAARPKFENLFNQLEKDLSIQIPKEDKEQLIKYIIYDEEGVFEVDGSISSMENFYLNKIAEGACDYLDDEKAARYFIPRAQKIIKEVFDNNIRISSLDSPLIDNSPLRDEFLSIIDKYFNPASDEEMLKVIQGLQEADDDTVDKLFDLLSDEEIGIHIKPAYDYILKYKEGNMDVIRELSSVITSGIIYSELNLSKDDDENETPDELFRTLLIRLSDLDVQKYIKAFKAEAFQKYQVRQAFPNPVVLKDEKIEDVVFSVFESLKEDVSNIKGGNYYINMFENYEDFERKTSNTELMKDINQNKNKLLKDENPEEIEQMKQSLQVLLDCIGEADDEFKGLIKAVNAIMHKLQNEDENTTCFELSKDIKAMRKIVSDWDTLNQIRYKIKLLVNTNVEEKYRNDVYNKLNKLVVLYKKDADEKVIKQLENEISENITDKHIVKNPVKLLVECVKDVQNGDIEKDDYQVRKTYLQEALQVALQTRVQYKLVQNQHESIGSKLKDMLEMFHVTLSDGRTLPMSDTVGLVYLVEQLKNSNDDNKTLNLFLQQSGLSQGALEALISTFDINQSKDFVDEKCKNIKLNLKEFKKVNDEITKYINSSKIKYKSFPEITEQLGKYMKRKFALKNNNIAKQYIDYLNSIQFEDTHYNIAPSMILTYFNAVNDDILQAILEENINVGIDYIDKLSQMLSDRMMLLYTIDVPNDSEVSKEREEFRQKYEDTQLYISQKFDDIKQTAYKNNVLAFK